MTDPAKTERPERCPACGSDDKETFLLPYM